MSKYKNQQTVESFKEKVVNGVHRPHFIYMAEHEDFANFLLEVVDEVTTEQLTKKKEEVKEEKSDCFTYIGVSRIRLDNHHFDEIGRCIKCGILADREIIKKLTQTKK